MARHRRIGPGELPIETVALARALVGCTLVRDSVDGRAAGRIVETEAYVPGDPASHAYGGQSIRNASMFLAPHHAYVYQIYGTSYCVNVTSEESGTGAAVLLRALEPLEGIALMQRRRETSLAADLCRGPGRLCRALGIDRALDGANLLRSRELWLSWGPPEAATLGTSTRIGITKAADRALRFFAAGSPFVSGPKRLSR